VIAVAVAALVGASPAFASPSFGFERFEASFTEAPPAGSPAGTLGPPDTQAGSHPYAATVSFTLNSTLNEEGHIEPIEDIKNLEVELPPGLVGNPTAVPRCTRQQLDHGGGCPADTQIGETTTVITAAGPLTTVGGEVFNMVPPAGVPAQFAVNVDHNFVFLEAHVRSGGNYGITMHVEDLPQVRILSSTTTIYGTVGGEPLLTMPTACEGPLTVTARANTWQQPTAPQVEKNAELPAMTGCEHLSFPPAFSAAPDTGEADKPAGLTFNLTVPQEGLLTRAGLSASDIKDTTVTLPEGLVINPGQAAGLQACPLGPASSELGHERYGDNLPLPGENGEEDRFEGPAHCPSASKVGTVTIRTPLIEGAEEKQFEGEVFVLQSEPPELKLLIAASADGVNLKLVGEVGLCENAGEIVHGKTCAAPGQLITTFAHTPELPFTDFKLSFSGGAQAALDTPTRCGEYTTTSDFTPWSSPFIPDAFPTSTFAITSGADGGACPPGALPFAPSLIAGSTTDQAGGFTNFSLLLQRGDGQQRIEKLQFKAPQGLGGMLSTVAQCPEPQASKGECTQASQIGHATVASGPGPYPLVLPQPGDPELPIYLTGPYGGAPFGLSIVTPVLAGPFNLGTIITRAKIEVDPHTAQITVTTNPLPQVVAGVPTDLRLIGSVIDRPGFMFNPTNCNPSSFSGTAWGTPPPGAGGPGATAPISSHFQVGSCRGLEFAPKFSVRTSGKTSKSQGASLTAKVSYPNGPQGTYADIGYVKVELPKQLPSRLTTLQKACTNAQFEANPAGCPSASMIGQAVVHTPELPVALTGPAIFVSHGGEAFPSLTLVLQGDGVRIDLVGTTFISKKGITSTTFKTVPDAPFSTFELTLPEGKYSALAANGNLCTQKVTMPNEFVAQNGAVLHQDTKISVTGCAKKKSLTRAQKLAAALKTCRTKSKGKRVRCERRARNQYASAKVGAKRKHNKQY